MFDHSLLSGTPFAYHHQLFWDTWICNDGKVPATIPFLQKRKINDDDVERSKTMVECNIFKPIGKAAPLSYASVGARVRVFLSPQSASGFLEGGLLIGAVIAIVQRQQQREQDLVEADIDEFGYARFDEAVVMKAGHVWWGELRLPDDAELPIGASIRLEFDGGTDYLLSDGKRRYPKG